MHEESTPLELVVARYEEDLSWLRKVPDAIKVTVYNKGPEERDALPLPNVGRESHTYLHHIVSRYETLADTTLFCQGRPFDHVPSFHRLLRELAEAGCMERAFTWYGFIVDWDNQEGSRLFCHWSKNEDGRRLDMRGFWETLWDEACPERFAFFPSGHFAVTADQVRQQPKAFYEDALELSTRDPDIGHCFERCWDKIFGVDGIPESLKGREMPVYLRPVERLGITWDDVPPEFRGW